MAQWVSTFYKKYANITHNKSSGHNQRSIAECRSCLREHFFCEAAKMRMQRRLSESCIKKQGRGPMSERALKGMMVKFEKTEQLGVLPERG
ncbi:hypothetical protein TNCT_653001 [Trichonephila clavata]|uniref:Uncharacterized protein n=1 Tax=Trichonephila clavata TaxID=2740835 RepID=A0A8X6FXS0_TRICU|nr:hypothetical protein TNCT_653001 [Trichonephila clavata]